MTTSSGAIMKKSASAATMRTQRWRGFAAVAMVGRADERAKAVAVALIGSERGRLRLRITLAGSQKGRALNARDPKPLGRYSLL